MSTALPALLAGLAVAVVLLPAPVAPRLGVLLPTPVARERAAPPRRTRQPGPAVSCALGGVAVWLLLGGPAGLVLGAVVGLVGPRALGHLEPRAEREDRERLAADLPLALDLLAACLAGGAALAEAVRAVADAVPGACGQRLTRVGAAMEVGSPPQDAWQALTAGPPSKPPDELAAAAVRALTRAGEGGAPVAAAVARLAAEAREQARARGQAAAERAGVFAVAPLGLCFLPAFVLLGVVPVIAGLVGPLLAGF